MPNKIGIYVILLFLLTTRGFIVNSSESVPVSGNETKNDTVAIAAKHDPSSNDTRPGGSTHDNEVKHGTVEHGEHLEIEIVGLQWNKTRDYFILIVWVVLAGIAQTLFHQNHKLSSIFPESSLLLLVGLFSGLVLIYLIDIDAEDYHTFFVFNEEVFFYVMLPPLILEAGFFMPKQPFFNNLGTILVFAIIGTLFNTACIGATLYMVFGVWKPTSTHITLSESLTYSSLISAVDPVAVLAVFVEIQVNKVLNIVIFGESLLNDAVTVVLYNCFKQFTQIEAAGRTITGSEIALSVAKFFVVAGGGTLFGFVFGYLTALATRFTKDLRVVEPIMVIGLSFMAYLVAELFHFSGILAAVFCGIVMKKYVTANVTTKSLATIKCMIKMIARLSETIIFIFLGTSALMNISVDWDVLFIAVTLVSCLVFRTLGVLIFTPLVNIFRKKPLKKTDQFIMAYGGLRGAIAFCLCEILPVNIAARGVMQKATAIVILFTVFVQGTTIKPIVNMLKVKRDVPQQRSMIAKFVEKSLDHIMVAIETISTGNANFSVYRQRYKRFEEKYLDAIFCRDAQQSHQLVQTMDKLSYKDALNMLRNKSEKAELEPLSLDDANVSRGRQLWGIAKKKMIKSSSQAYRLWDAVLNDVFPDLNMNQADEAKVKTMSLDDDEDASEFVRSPAARKFIDQLLQQERRACRKQYSKQLAQMREQIMKEARERKSPSIGLGRAIAAIKAKDASRESTPTSVNGEVPVTFYAEGETEKADDKEAEAEKPQAKRFEETRAEKSQTKSAEETELEVKELRPQVGRGRWHKFTDGEDNSGFVEAYENTKL